MESLRAARRGKGSAKQPSASVRPSLILRQANQKVRPQNSRCRLWMGGPWPRSPAKTMRPTSRLSRCPAGSSGRRGNNPAVKRCQAPRSRRNCSYIHSIMIVSGLSMIFDLPTWR